MAQAQQPIQPPKPPRRRSSCHLFHFGVSKAHVCEAGEAEDAADEWQHDADLALEPLEAALELAPEDGPTADLPLD